MRFEIWITLDENRSVHIQERRILNKIIDELEYMTHRVDDEKIMYVDVQINSLEDLMVLPFLLEDDIVIYGVESNIIMTKKTMKELGLD